MTLETTESRFVASSWVVTKIFRTAILLVSEWLITDNKLLINLLLINWSFLRSCTGGKPQMETVSRGLGRDWTRWYQKWKQK